MLYCRILATIGSLLPISTEAISQPWDVFDQAKRLVEAESFGRRARLARPPGDRWRSPMATLSPGCTGQRNSSTRSGGDRQGSHPPRHRRSRRRPASWPPLLRCVRHRVVLELLLARCVTDREEAEKHAATAVETAVGNSLLQTIASEGIETVELVEHGMALDEWLARLRRLADADLVASGSKPAGRAADRAERDVLRSSPSRLTIREIADELYVSVNTLKFHLKVIYRKLGVNSRAEAAEAAQDDFAASIVPGSRQGGATAAATAR